MFQNVFHTNEVNIGCERIFNNFCFPLKLSHIKSFLRISSLLTLAFNIIAKSVLVHLAFKLSKNVFIEVGYNAGFILQLHHVFERLVVFCDYYGGCHEEIESIIFY
jgi:hypothetical protein